MKSYAAYTFLLCGLVLGGCHKNIVPPIAQPEAKTIKIYPKNLSSGGHLSRDLYRSFWVLPSKDDDFIHLGLIPSTPKATFSSERPFRIRIHEEQTSWDIQSPAGVTWEVTFSKQVRPKMVRYFATIDHQVLKPGQHLENNKLLPWIEKGFKNAQWVGPPKMDARNKKNQLTRHFLAIDVFSKEQAAADFCKTFNRTHHKVCTVVGRMDLPALGTGKLNAFDNAFSQNFTGIIEVIPDPKLKLFNVPTKLMTSETRDLTIRDSLFIIPNTKNEVTVVEVLTLKDYLTGVIPTEIFPNAPIEALKAQAIIARTYTLSQLWSRYALEPFYTCVTTRCQAYHGRKTLHKAVKRAINETQNLVLKNSDQNFDFTQTFYHASSGGITDQADIIFGQRTSYPGGTIDLTSNADIDLTQHHNVKKLIDQKLAAFCTQNTFSKGHGKWLRKISAAQLKQFFGKPVKNIQVLKRSISGRATKINIAFASGNKTIQGELNIRKALGALPSSLFYVKKKKTSSGMLSQVFIYGRGRGHGVGLSQLGAIGRAQAGQNVQKILNAYYPKTILKPIL